MSKKINLPKSLILLGVLAVLALVFVLLMPFSNALAQVGGSTLTRAEAAQRIVDSFGLPSYTCGGQPFNDEVTNAAAINSLYEASITSGCGNGQFCATRPISNNESAYFLNEVANYILPGTNPN